MKTKLSIIFLSAAILMLSCVRENLPVTDSSTGLLCRIEGGVPATKTILKDDPGVRMVTKWQSDDAIGIFGDNASNTQYSIVASSISDDGKTAEFKPQASASSGTLLAYCPYQEGVTRSGASLIVSFPDNQRYDVSGNLSGPDPAANILAGIGNVETGISFRPVAAILKIGQAFDDAVTLAAVEFRDLEGKAVSGKMKITPGEAPAAEITGSGQVITLTFGDGLALEAGQKRPLYMIVPARQYEKGFSLTFVTEDGSRSVKTIGAAAGITLVAGTVYPVGDITRYNYLAGDSFKLKDGALLVTPEKADLMKIIKRSTHELLDASGNAIPLPDGVGYYHGPALELIVRQELNLREGNFLIFEQDSEMLPSGGILKVMTSESLGGGYCRVYAISEANVAAPYAKLELGGEMYDADGNLDESKGENLDLADYVTDIKDDEGKSVSFSMSPSGELLLSGESAERLLGVKTKGSASPSFALPALSLNIKKPNLEAVFSAALTLNTRIAAGAVQGEFQYLYVTVNPVFNLGADFKLKAELSETLTKHLFTLYCAPIPIAPGVMVTPEMDISGYVGIGGSLVFSTSLKYRYDMGTFGVSYNKGDGFTTRHMPPVPEKEDGLKMELGGLTGTLSASGGFSLHPKFTIYGLIEVGVKASCGLVFGVDFNVNQNGFNSPKVYLQPAIEMYPFIASLGGYFTKDFKDLTVSVNLDPLWERYLWPRLNVNLGFYGPIKNMKSFGYKTLDDVGSATDRYIVKIMSPVLNGHFFRHVDAIFTHIDGMKYRVISPLPTIGDWDLYVEYLSGGTMGTPVVETPWAPVWCTDGPYFGVPSSGMAVKERYCLAHIAAGSKDTDITDMITGGIPDNEAFAYRLVLVNKFTGKEYDLDMNELGGRIDVPYTHMISWPKTPDGQDYFECKKIVREEDFDNSVPLKPISSMYEADGYAYPPVFD
jgi:hypothetical protein